MAWNEPYLETCCRAALHRLRLAGALGRPDDGMDAACLARLIALGLARARADGRPDGRIVPAASSPPPRHFLAAP